MGSLLSFLTYMESPEQIIGIVAIDTPLYVRVKGRALKNNLKVGFCKEIPESDPAHTLLEASSVAPCSILTYLSWVPRMINLFCLMKKTREVLPQVSIPTLVFHADDDELVSASSVKCFQCEVLRENNSGKVLTTCSLKRVNSFFYGNADWDLLYYTFSHFLQSC